MSIFFGISACVMALHLTAVHGARDLIKVFAPAYQPMSEAEKQQELRKLHEQNSKWYSQSGQKSNNPYAESYAAATADSIERSHMERYYLPREEGLKDVLHIGFGAGYVALVLALLKISANWFTAILPLAIGSVARNASAMGKMASAHLPSVPARSGLRAMLDRARMKSVESDYMRLKNLHENGLISDDDFEERKSALADRINK